MAITGFIGDIGGGKTASMVREAYIKHIQEDKKIISNMRLNFNHQYITLDNFMSMIDNKENLTDCILLLDELHIWLDSRTSMSKRNRVVSYLLLQSRKLSIDIFYTTQYITQVDVRVRNLTNTLVECYTDVSPEDSEKYTLNIVNIRKINKMITRKHIFKTRYVYNLYDTNEVISIS